MTKTKTVPYQQLYAVLWVNYYNTENHEIVIRLFRKQAEANEFVRAVLRSFDAYHKAFMAYMRHTSLEDTSAQSAARDSTRKALLSLFGDGAARKSMSEELDAANFETALLALRRDLVKHYLTVRAGSGERLYGEE